MSAHIDQSRSYLYGLGARAISLLNAIVIIYLGSHRLHKDEQGLYYALTSIAALQTVFEIGFPSLLLQYAGHERQRLRTAGHTDAMINVGLLLQHANRWFGRAAIICALAIAMLAWYMFRAEPIAAWGGPAAALAVAVSASLATTGRWAIFEGLGNVEQVLLARLVAAVVSLGFVFLLFESGHALYIPSGIALASVMAFVAMIAWPARDTWREVSSAAFQVDDRLAARPSLAGIRSLQTRTAASFVCGYLSFQAVTLIAYRNGSPALAATVGISMTVMMASISVVSILIQTRVQTFFRLIADQDAVAYFALGRKTQLQSLSAMLGLTVIGLVALVALRHFGFAWAHDRLPEPLVLAVFMAAAAVNQCIAVQATQVRSFKAEPYVGHSLVVAVSVVIVVAMTAHQNDALALSIGYLAVNLIVALPYSAWIFRDQRRLRLGASTPVRGDT